VQSAIATLPWVETDSIKADGTKLQVRFAVKDVKQFDEKALIEALKSKGSRYSDGAHKLSGPSGS